MAAYAAVATLMHTIEQIQHHPRPPISLDKDQVESLSKKLTFLQEFLQNYSHGLESRIADAVRAAEDMIESHLVDHILDGSTSDGEKKFHECLEKVVDDMDLIIKEVMEIKDTITPIQLHLHRDPPRSSLVGQNVVVGVDGLRIEILGKLIGEESTRQILPIVGMGGIGKTTLAKTLYSNRSIQQHFDVCAWTAISEAYNIREIFIQILSQASKKPRENLLENSENDLEEDLHKALVGRRYLIILDDIWNIEVWDSIQRFFPDCNNRSRVVITTRLSNLASQVNETYCLKMKFLDEEESWKLFCKLVFGGENCPLELEEIGKKIARGCKGLPLSICVVGGLLANSKDELGYWEHIAKYLSLVVNSDDNEYCLKILHLSYSELPTHLKPCFLHMGVFPEDEKVRVTELIELWIAEGFLKPIGGKTLDDVAEEYFIQLIQRNLISVHSLGSIGTIKYCNIHDLLRDLCLRQVRKERFDNVLELHNYYNPHGIDIDNLFVSDDLPLKQKYHDAYRSLQLASSLYYYTRTHPVPLNTRMLRIWAKCRQSFYLRYGNFLNNMFLCYFRGFDTSISSVNHFWNLQTFIMYNWMVLMVPSQIWNMPHLRHVKAWYLELPDPPHDGFVLGNLRTLSTIKNFKCSEEMIKRIPNIKKLQIEYTSRVDVEASSFHFLHNIDRLCKLESLSIAFLPCPVFWQNLTFPNSLKKLTIERFWADQVLKKIGSLPLLAKLKLRNGSFGTREWATVEGQFLSLKFLLIEECFQLEYWQTESTHFPRLEVLTLQFLKDLKEIPLDIGEIPTLESINVNRCSDSVVVSAKKIQEEAGNEGLKVRVQ